MFDKESPVFRNLVEQLTQRERSTSRKRKTRHTRRTAFLSQTMRRLQFERLEDRRVLATITVDTFDDELNSDGDCSLREAIEAANTNRYRSVRCYVRVLD